MGRNQPTAKNDAGTPRRATKSKTRPRADVNAERTEARWDAILAAANEEFQQRGFSAVRLADVAARVGLLKGSLYYYFNAKEDLFYAVVERGFVDTLRLLRADPTPVTEPAGRRLRIFIDRLMADRRKILPWAPGFEHDYQHLREAQRRRIVELRREVVATLQVIIVDGVTSGEFNGDFDPDVMANIILQMVVSTTRWRPANSRVSWTELTDHYWLIASRALGAPDAATDHQPIEAHSASALPQRQSTR